MAIIDAIKAKARADKKVIVLPESMDARTYEACEKLVKEDLVKVVLIAPPENVEKFGAGFDLTGVTVIDPSMYVMFSLLVTSSPAAFLMTRVSHVASTSSIVTSVAVALEVAVSTVYPVGSSDTSTVAP